MKKRKLVLALMLSLMMLVTMIPSFSFADETGGTGSSAGSGTPSAATSGNCGATGNDHVTWSFDKSSGTLTISGSGAMADYASGGSVPWNAEKAKITSVKIENGVERIGNRSFMWCPNITKIDIPDSVTAYGTNCFHSCTSLQSLTVGKNVSSLGQIGIYLDTAMTNVIVESGNKYYASVDNWIYKLNSDHTATVWQVPAGVVKDKTSITVPDTISWDGVTYKINSIGNVSDGGYTLSGAVNMKTISFGDAVAEIGTSAFNGCKALTTIDLKNVTELGAGAFIGCSKLDGIVLNNGVAELPNSVFQGCSSLSELVIPQNVTDIGRYAFADTGISEINLADKVKNIGNFAFSGCTSLVKVTGGKSLERLETEGVKKGAVFGGCSKLMDVDLVGTSALVIPSTTFGNPSDSNVPVKNFSLENGSFANGFSFILKTVETLHLGEGVETVPEKICDGQTALTSVEIPGAVTVGTNAFHGCTKLETVKFGDKLTSIGETAFQRTALVNVKIPSTVESIGKSAFGNCDALNMITFKGEKVDFGSAVLNANKNMIAVDLSSVSNLTLSGKDSMAINRSGAKVAACYVSGADQQKIMANQFTAGTVYFGVTNGGTFAANTDFAEGTLVTPIKSGFKFLGWYDNAACTGEAVTAPQTGNVYYANWKAKAEQKLSYNTKEVEKHINDGAFTNPLTKLDNGGDVTYTSNDEKIATVNEKGEVAIVGAGTATITATAAETGNYKEAVASYDLIVTDHQLGNKWESDGDNHWHVCEICQKKVDPADHEFQWVVDKEATTTEKGSKHEKCTVCGYEKKAVEIPVIENGTTDGDQNSGNAGNSTKANAANGAKTGDTMPIGMLAVLMLAAGAGIAFCGRKLYKSR